MPCALLIFSYRNWDLYCLVVSILFLSMRLANYGSLLIVFAFDSFSNNNYGNELVRMCVRSWVPIIIINIIHYLLLLLSTYIDLHVCNLKLCMLCSSHKLHCIKSTIHFTCVTQIKWFRSTASGAYMHSRAIIIIILLLRALLFGIFNFFVTFALQLTVSQKQINGCVLVLSMVKHVIDFANTIQRENIVKWWILFDVSS